MLFGLVTVFIPGVTLVTLVLLFGAYARVDGVFKLDRRLSPGFASLGTTDLMG